MYPNDWPGLKEVGQTALGGPTYEGTRYPAEYRGTAFYGDYGEKTIRRLVFDGSGKVARTEPFATESEWMVDLEAGPTGNLVTVDITYGVIREIVYFAQSRAQGGGHGHAPQRHGPAERELRRHGIDGSRQRHPEL